MQIHNTDKIMMLQIWTVCVLYCKRKYRIMNIDGLITS